jgi:hypothetical protein
MDANRLFIERCDQVAILLESHKELDLLDLAAKLRQLLFDQHSLADTVNTSPIRLEFRVGEWSEMPPGIPKPTLWTLEDGLDPETGAPTRGVVVLSRDEFGQYPVAYFQNHPIKVRDVIRYAAHVAGGIHHDPQPQPEYRVLHALSQSYGIGGLPLGVRQLKAIGRVGIRGMRPLIEDVKQRR